MNITWLGHGSFRIEIEQAVLLVDPWLTGNPSFPDVARAQALADATHILLTHGHFDHTAEVEEITNETSATIVGIPELAGIFEDKGFPTIDYNKGGTVDLGGAAVTMVNAVHSSSMTTPAGPLYTGTESGYMIAGEGHTIYFSGDTDIMADMEWMGDLHKPGIGILCAGGHYTMDMARAAYAAKRYFNFKTVIPCHYKTFPLLEQSAQTLIDGLPGVDVKTPEVMETLSF